MPRDSLGPGPDITLKTWPPADPVHPVLIVALDVPTLAEASALVERLRPVTPWFKVGSVLFTAVGPEAVRLVHAAGGRVFLDLKFHDIPRTVAGAVSAAAELGVALVTVHCTGGHAMLEAAATAAARSLGRTRVLGVTRLTSDAGRVGPSVLRAADAAKAAGLDGVTASARECARIKARCGAAFRVLTPGIRPAGSVAGDQVRIVTPAQAVRAGSDYLVVGRPILMAPDPAAAAAAIVTEIGAAAAQRPRALAMPVGSDIEDRSR
ncbi:MAG: orotidine-5'-phosphate decarboxylase [Armatimonadota bacterium]|nr:orotidine-5'-phosphate decarboxylase [Armatimonadota bacterium]